MALPAILSPGQGSQSRDMRETVAQVRPDLLADVVALVGEDPFPRADEGTGYAQPAIFCASLAGWAALGRPEGEFMAGPPPRPPRAPGAPRPRSGAPRFPPGVPPRRAVH